jgi:hypothetical protein
MWLIDEIQNNVFKKNQKVIFADILETRLVLLKLASNLSDLEFLSLLKFLLKFSLKKSD